MRGYYHVWLGTSDHLQDRIRQPHTLLSSAEHYIPLIIWGISLTLSLSGVGRDTTVLLSQWFHFARGSHCTL